MKYSMVEILKFLVEIVPKCDTLHAEGKKTLTVLP